MSTSSKVLGTTTLNILVMITVFVLVGAVVLQFLELLGYLFG